MDQDAERNKLESDLRYVEAWQKHPITSDVLADNREEQEQTIKMLCDFPITNVETFFAHHSAVGYLRGLRRAAALVQENVEEFKTKLQKD